MAITAEAARDWGRRETARRRCEELPPGQGPKLLPPERFSDEYAPADPRVPGKRGPQAGVVRSVLAGACSGWGQRPDGEEFYEAMRAESPTSRQQTINGVLIAEGSLHEVLLAHLQGAFTWRQLVRAMHRRGHYKPRLAAFVNRFAMRR